MLSQFYNYLSDKIIDFFRENLSSSGLKYNIQFETEREVRELFEALRKSSISKSYEYIDNGVIKYRSYLLDFDKFKIIVAATIDNVQADFLTRLRNLVGVENGYENKSILFIHDTVLDSILGGTESFNKEGMPFNENSIQKDIRNKMNNSSFSEVDKAIIDLDLEKKKNEVDSDSFSVFEYKELLNVVSGDGIKKDQYKDFNLFYDSNLKDFSGRYLKKRLEENMDYYTKIDDIHKYGDPDIQLEKFLDGKGVEKLRKENWKDTEFKDVKKSIEDKKSVKPLEYLGDIKCSLTGWDKEEGTTKVKSRIRNIIIFNEKKDEEINIEFPFDESLRSSSLQTSGAVQAIASGKKIRATLSNEDGKTQFYKIIYTNDKDNKNEKFQFKIVVISCSEQYLENIKAKYQIVMKKKQEYICINSNDCTIVFNELGSENQEKNIIENNEEIITSNERKLTINIDEMSMLVDEEIVNFKINLSNNIIPMGFRVINEKLAPIEGINVWKLKREKETSFSYIGDNKIQHGTREYFTREEFRRNIELERELIEKEGLYYKEFTDELNIEDLQVNEVIKESFKDIVKYYKTNKNIPSLTYLDDDLAGLYKNFIKIFIEEIGLIEEGSYLTKSQKDLFKIGVVKRCYGDKEIMLTPLHPLNIAYQLMINERVGNEELDMEIIKKLSATYLLPYLIDVNDNFYTVMEQCHSPEWKYYVDEKLPRYKGSRDFVSKLVTDKIEEFTGHFKYLFEMSSGSPIKINLINTGDSKEILQGIFNYYVKQLKNSKGQEKEIIPMEVYIYSHENITNAFEELAFNNDVDNIKEIFKLNLTIDNMSEKDVLNFYREKVDFYSKKDNRDIEYAHITFLEMYDDIKIMTSNMDDIYGGEILDGLSSGVSSVFLGDSYRTGFGTKYTNINNDLMKVAINLNALNSAITGEPFNRNQCKAISIPNANKKELDVIYNSSHWVTFINPKVDLNFFKNDPNSKDLLIIHYSDQYTTNGGYDAITVTRKSISYERVIEEFLEEKNIENAKKYLPEIINMFNAINGDWLLRLLSRKSQFPREKISILSAIKLALAYFEKKNIIWVPISLEEILRVSGGAGLKQNEGFFSTKNLGFDKKGATSDDILLVGIENKDTEVLVNIYPIEVKIGINESNYIQKGIEQAKQTYKIFKETLSPNEDGEVTITKKVYKNFLMQLVINSAEKMSLYNVCDSIDYNSIVNSDIRRKLLNEEYRLSEEVLEEMQQACVISFKSGVAFNNVRKEDNVLILEFTEEDGINYITKNISEIRREILVGEKEIAIEQHSAKEQKEGKGISDFLITSKSIKNEDKINEIKDKFISQIDNEGICEEKDNKYCEVDESNDLNDNHEKNDEGMKIVFGVNQNNNEELVWYPNNSDKVSHPNTGIIGNMGTGKTQFTKSVITQLYRQSKFNVDSKELGILIFDYKGDYNKNKTDFIEATNAKVFDLYDLPFNPLSLAVGNNTKNMLPLHVANSLKETLAKAFGLGIKQETLLREIIMEAYTRKGIDKKDSLSWTKDAPTINDVYNIYIEREDLKEDSLYAAFTNLIDFEIFEPDSKKTKSLYDLIEGVTVIDLSGYDSDIQNLVVAITLDLFYSQMQAHGHSKIEKNLRQLNKIILVDEADNFLSKNFSSLKKILKEGREFGVATILSTQLLSHFSTGENEYANYILTWIVHNVADLNTKDIKYIFNTKQKQDDETIYNKIKSLNKHYSLVKTGNSDRPIYIKDRAFWEIIEQNK